MSSPPKPFGVKSISRILSIAIVALGIISAPNARVSADTVIFENFGSPAFPAYYIASTNWNTFGDLLVLDANSNHISEIRFHMFASDVGDANMAFSIYENDNNTVGNELWSSGVVNHEAAARGRFDVLFDDLAIETSNELFVGIAIQNYNIAQDGMYLSPIFGGTPTTGSSNSKSAIFNGGAGMMGFIAGTPLEIDLDDCLFEINFQLTMSTAIPEPASAFMMIATGICLLRRRHRQG